MDGTTLTILVGGLSGAVGTVAGVVGKTLVARSQRGAQMDNLMAQIVHAEQTAHAQTRAEHARTRDELSQARTSEQLLSGQVGDLAARVELMEDRDKQREAEHAERELAAERRNDECEERVAALTARVRKLERHGVTPPGGTPAVESSDRIRPPVMSESVGYSNGYTRG